MTCARRTAAALLAFGALPAIFATACGGDDEPSARSSAMVKSTNLPLQSNPGRGVKVWAVGDGADGSDTARLIARMIRRDDPAKLLYLGDVYPDGTRADFRVRYADGYGQLRHLTLPTPGNHDWPNHAVGYDPYWANARGRRQPYHYATRIAGWRILSLNSEDGLDEDSPQVRWLARQVEDGGSCRIAFWHRPRLSAGSHGDDASVEPLWQLVQGKAALLLSGHDHNMQEFRRQGGTIQLIAGAGGDSVYEMENDPRLRWGTDRTQGAIRLLLRRGHARYEFVSKRGRVLRSGATRCQPG